MRKKDKQIQETEPKVITLEEIMGDRFGRYSKYIIQERALPDARDGLKPVQRRILYAMQEANNTYDHQYRKSAKTVGLVIGNYHPHGDSSVYDAMVRLSQDWKVRCPLIDMHGNNGSIDDDPAAAMRYTEARLAKISSIMMEDINKETVEFTPNFDDTDEEPTVLPTKLPTLLINGATGIAAGYATNIAPGNLNEIIDGTIYRLQNPTSSLEEIMNYITGPDFPTGGVVQGKKGIIDAYRTGKGRVVIRGKAEIVENRQMKQIIITEIPYEVIKSNLVRKMDDIRLNKDIDGIIDVRDESDRNGLKIVCDIKNDVDAQLVLNYFYKNTDLSVYYNYNMVAIVDKTPRLMGIIPLLDAFINHRKEVVIRRCRYDLAKMENRCHILEGLMRSVSIMDEIIALIRQSKDKQEAKSKLQETYSFTEIQAEAIVNLRLYRLTSTDIVSLRDEFALLVNQMEELKSIINSNKVLISEIVKELKMIKQQFSSPRRSVIEDEITEIVIDKTSMITNERVMVTVSKDGYLKRCSLRSYNSYTNQDPKMKDTDELIGYLEVDTLDTLLLFTSQGHYAYLPVYELHEEKWMDIGNHLSSYMSINNEDKIINAIVVKNFNTQAYICTISKKGYIKKTAISSWQVSRYNKTYSAMKLKKGDQMIKAFICYEQNDIALITKNGYLSRYHHSLISETGVKSLGVIAMKLTKDDELVSATAISSKNQSLLIMAKTGNLKRIKEQDVLVTSRPVKGYLACKKLKTNPYQIKEMLAVSPIDSLVIYDQTEKYSLLAKDITLMSKEATFSSPLKLTENYYYLKNIEECLIVDFINVDENEEEVHAEYEPLSLFEGE